MRWGVGKAERDGTRSSAFPQVSIVIAARNEAQHIEACLRSVLAQDYPRGRLE
ncbi:MAG: glycosyltransferase family 2 protein, partial [candidate division KSB1 bacterium]|nr:glycosyltransferase family 2 protein [candidate division KSB1 bacterium]